MAAQEGRPPSLQLHVAGYPIDKLRHSFASCTSQPKRLQCPSLIREAVRPPRTSAECDNPPLIDCPSALCINLTIHLSLEVVS